MKALLALLSALAVLSAAPASVNARGKKRQKPENNKHFQKEHPRRTEVLKRDDRESHRANEATREGKLTKGQDARIQRQEHSIRRQEQRDAAEHGGQITKGEQRRLNREENGVNREIDRDERRDARTAAGRPENAAGFEKNHPRRTEVLKRTDSQRAQANDAVEDGKLTGRQAARIKAEDRNIRRQEQRDAAENGGFITKGEQQQLNREENGVERQMKREEAADAAAK